MAGQAEAARMGQAVPVAHEGVDRWVQLPQGGQDRRRLAERQQTRHVREAERTNSVPGLDDLPLAHVPDDGCGQACITAGKCRIDAGHVTDVADRTALHNPRRQSFLNGDGLRGGDVPAMRGAGDVHENRLSALGSRLSA